MSIPLGGNQTGYMDAGVSDICICKTNRGGIVLTCKNPTCPYNNRIHPQCFNMSDDEVKRALSSN